MEIIQSKSPNTSSRKWNITTAIVAAIALSVHWNTEADVSIWWNIEISNAPRSNMELNSWTISNRVDLIEKKHTHNWPLGDKVCTYVYQNKDKVLWLCTFKPPKIIETYTKLIPWRSIMTPGGPKFVPEWGSIVWSQIQMAPGKIEMSPPKLYNHTWYLMSCNKINYYDQVNWEISMTRESCT